MDSSHTQTDGLTAEAGLAAVFIANRGSLLRFLALRCVPPLEAEDILQEMWVRLGQVRSGPLSNPSAYLYRMANNLVIDASRARHAGAMREGRWLASLGRGDQEAEICPDPAPLADEVLIEAQRVEAVARAIAALPKGAAMALRLHRLEGVPQAQVARQMGISVSGVEKHLANGLRLLRAALIENSGLDWGSEPRIPSSLSSEHCGGKPAKEQT